MPPIVLLSAYYALGIVVERLLGFHLFSVLTLVLVLAAFLIFGGFRGTFVLFLLFMALGMLSFGVAAAGPSRHGGSSPLPFLVVPINAYFKGISSRLLPEPYSSLYMSMIFGQRSAALPAEMQENFRKTGTIHLLVVSGLQMALLMGSLSFCFRSIRAGPPVTFTASMILGLAYFLVVGGGASIFRAYIMSMVQVAAACFERNYDWLASLSLAAMVILLFDPAALFNIGFQLSFAASFSLLYASPVILELVPSSLSRFTREALATSVSPFLFTFPIILMNFGQFSPVSLPANILIVPFIGHLTVASFISMVASAVLPFMSVLFSGALLACFFTLRSVIALFASLPFACYYLRPPGPAPVIGYYICLIAGLHILKGRGKVVIHRRHFYAACSAFILLFLVQLCSSAMAPPPRGELVITVLDVGQGDSIFIETPSGRKILVDGGETRAGKNVVLPFLRKKGVGRLDVVILSHAHSDHVGGLVPVLENINVDLVLDPGLPHTSNYYRNFLELVEKNEAKYSTPRPGYGLDMGDGVSFKFLWPKEPFISGSDSDLNNNSIVFRLLYKDFSMLFPGDLGTAGEKALLGSGFSGACDALKVGHHGSRTSSAKGFLAVVRPSVSVISVGAGNSYGHPSPETLKRLEAAPSNVYRTDLNGTVVIRTDGQDLSVRTER